MKRANSDEPLSQIGFCAFTLIELILAVAITGVLVSFLLALTVQVTAIWNRSTSRLSATNQAQLILDRLEQDLQCALIARDSNVWLAATIQRSPQAATGDAGMVDATWSGLTKPNDADPGTPGSSLNLAPDSAELADYRFGQGSVWLRLLTTQADSNVGVSNYSAPRAVAYQISRRRVTASATSSDPLRAPVRYVLYRSTVRPMSTGSPDVNSTIAAGYDLFMPAVGLSYNLGDASRIDDVGNLRMPRRYEQVLGNNIVDFGVRVWIRDDANNLVCAFPAAAVASESAAKRGFAATARDGTFIAVQAAPPNPSGASSIAPEEMTYGFPEEVELFLRILSEDGARRLAAFEAGIVSRPADVPSDADYWWQLVLANSSTFTRRVSVRAVPI